MKTLDHRYFNDPTFSKLVDTFLAMIRELKTTPDEIREAALFAQIKFELERPRPIAISKGLSEELKLRGFK